MQGENASHFQLYQDIRGSSNILSYTISLLIAVNYSFTHSKFYQNISYACVFHPDKIVSENLSHEDINGRHHPQLL